MTVDDDRRLRQLYRRARELDPAVRARFIDEACADEPAEIRVELEALLASLAEAPPARPADADAILTLPSTALNPLPGVAPKRIGQYRILGTLGEGGMGIVYLAEQYKPRRKVALKLVKWGMDTKRVLARFESERETLARLNHPYIAKVFDAGTTQEGRAFFVMERVEGVALTEHCDRNRLTTEARLELFVKVCEGVQHAHHKAIIHRDLKPSNILVSVEGDRTVPKIIDFGVAKATAHRLAEETIFTEIGQMVGTPEYMSPEQAEMTAQDVDTRTDVYSLGVVLYQLLVGRLPFEPDELRKDGYAEIRRRIRDDEPLRPSTRLSTLERPISEHSAERRRTDLPTLRRQLRGDLDWIVMRALEKDRTRRYGSPAELTADIERHLADQPVLAGPPGTAYRVRKFVRRHRVGVLAGGLFAAALIAGILGTTIGMLRAVEARRGEALQRNKAEEITRFLQDNLLAGVDPYRTPDREITLREVLDTAAAQIENAFPEHPETEAAITRTIGQTYARIGDYSKAERYLRSAATIFGEVHGERHPETWRAEYALGAVLMNLGREDEAEAKLLDALDGLGGALGEDDPDTLTAGLNVGWLHYRRGEIAQAASQLESVVERSRRALGAHHEVTLLAGRQLVDVLLEQGDADAAESLSARVLDDARDGLGGQHPVTMRAMMARISILNSRADWNEAEAVGRELVDSAMTVLGPDHPVTLSGMSLLAWALRHNGKTDEAGELAEQAVQGLSESVGATNLQTLAAKINLAGVMQGQGRYGEAVQLLRSVYEAYRETLGPESLATTDAMNDLASALWYSRDLDGAGELYTSALEIRRRVSGDDHPDTLRLMANLAMIHMNRERFDEADALYTEALERQRRVLGPDHGSVANTMYNLMFLRKMQERWEECVELGERLLAIQHETLGRDHPIPLETSRHVSGCVGRTGAADEAVAMVRSALQRAESLENAPAQLIPGLRWSLGMRLKEAGAYAEAEAHLLAAQAYYRDKPPAPQLAKALAELAELRK